MEIEGHERLLGLEDGEIRIEPWANHRLYPPLPRKASSEEDVGNTTIFLLSGGKTEEVYRLDTIFFQNWYGYQDETVMRKAKMDLIQVLSVSYVIL